MKGKGASLLSVCLPALVLLPVSTIIPGLPHEMCSSSRSSSSTEMLFQNHRNAPTAAQKCSASSWAQPMTLSPVTVPLHPVPGTPSPLFGFLRHQVVTDFLVTPLQKASHETQKAVVNALRKAVQLVALS